MGEMAEFNGSPVVGLTGGALVAPHNYRADGMPWVHPWRDWSVLPVVESEEMARLHPVTAYLAKLAPGSRASQRSKLNRTAQLLSGGQHRTAETYPWHRLTNVDMQALRSHLAATRHHATATNYLTAVRSLLKMCRRLGLMSADACNAALD